MVSNKKLKVEVVGQGDRIIIEKNLYFDILWPRKNIIPTNILNNNSIVCKLVYKKFSCIYTGDIEEEAEKEILEDYSNNKILNSNILKVAHHGSKTSSTKEFLERVKPKVALIGVGENNNFGHPSNNVIEQLKELRYKNL